MHRCSAKIRFLLYTCSRYTDGLNHSIYTPLVPPKCVHKVYGFTTKYKPVEYEVVIIILFFFVSKVQNLTCFNDGLCSKKKKVEITVNVS